MKEQNCPGFSTSVCAIAGEAQNCYGLFTTINMITSNFPMSKKNLATSDNYSGLAGVHKLLTQLKKLEPKDAVESFPYIKHKSVATPTYLNVNAL